MFHFAPESTIYAHPLQVEIQLGLSFREDTVVAERTCLVNLDELKSHGSFSVAPSLGDELKQHQQIHLFTENEGSANVLKISNFPSSDAVAAELRKTKGITAKQVVAKQRERRWRELQECREILLTRLNLLSKKMAQESSRVNASAVSSDASSTSPAVHASRPASVPPRDSALIIDLTSARGVSFKDSFLRVCFDGVEKSTPSVKEAGSPAYNAHFQFSTTNMPGSSICRVELWQACSWPMADTRVAFTDFSLYDCDHVVKTSWLPLKVLGGGTVAELQATIWHVPKTNEHADASSSFHEIETQLIEKKRILRAIDAECESMQSRLMIDEQGRVMPVHLSNDVQFKVQLTSIEGFSQALKAMNNRGDVVCRMRSELTGKTASVLCLRYDPAEQANLPSPAATPTAASSSSSSSSAAPVAPAAPAAIVLPWSQTIELYVPEEMLATRDEVVHLSFFFHPEDFASDKEAQLPSSPKQASIRNEGFLKATKLRANCPPIPLAHASIALNAIPVFGSQAYKDSQSERNARDKRIVDWRNNRLPLQCDTLDQGWVTMSVTRMEATSEENRSQFCLKLALPQVSLSLIDAEPQEVLFFSISGIAATADDTLCMQTLECKIESLQLDNQNVSALFPIVLGFSPVEPEDKQPLVQLSVAKKKTLLPIALFQYASLLIQQMDVCIEEELIYTIIRFVNSFKEEDDSVGQLLSGADDDAKVFEKQVSKMFALNKQTELMLFFELLQIQPIALNVSFEASPGMRARMSGTAYNPMDLILSVAGTAMGSIQSAPIRLNGRTFEHVRGSVSVIVGSLSHHYRGEFLGEAYKIIGSLEFLGNPVGLVSGLGAGLTDFFYLPAKGAVQSPEKFGIGLAKGSLSLVKGAVGGVFNTAGSIVGSVSKGLAIASVPKQTHAHR